MATEGIYKFMNEQNRPFSIGDLENSFKDLGKAAIQKSLNKLIGEGKIFEKTYGKRSVYCVSQKTTEDDDAINMQETLKQLDRSVNEISINLKEGEEKLSRNLEELKQYDAKMSLAEAKSLARDLQADIDVLKNKIEILKSNSVEISVEDKKKIFAVYSKYCTEYKKRKRICNDILGSIMEGYPKSKKHFLEEADVETDEIVGFKFEEIPLK